MVAAMEEAGERGATTEVNASELLLGGYRHGRIRPDRLAAVERILSRVDVLSSDREGAARAAGVLARLRARGQDLGFLNALIAGIALAGGLDTVVTRGETFRRVPRLKVERY